MELVFMLTEWVYAQEGSKATSFDHVCKALAVQFDFSRLQSATLKHADRSWCLNCLLPLNVAPWTSKRLWPYEAVWALRTASCMVVLESWS